MIIRNARENECDALTALRMRSKAYWGYDADFMDACRDALSLTRDDLATSRVGVGEEDGKIIGVVEVAPLGADADLSIFIEPDAIGHGHGRALFDWAVEQTRLMGAARLIIDADPNALEFYKRMGAHVIGEVPSDAIPGRVLTRLARHPDTRD